MAASGLVSMLPPFSISVFESGIQTDPTSEHCSNQFSRKGVQSIQACQSIKSEHLGKLICTPFFTDLSQQFSRLRIADSFGGIRLKIEAFSHAESNRSHN